MACPVLPSTHRGVNVIHQFWSWALAGVGILGIYLAGRHKASGWLVGASAQVLWFAYAIVTRQWGFIFTAIAYAAIYLKNWWDWRTKAQQEKDLED